MLLFEFALGIYAADNITTITELLKDFYIRSSDIMVVVNKGFFSLRWPYVNHSWAIRDFTV